MPTLATILMVEDLLKHQSKPISLSNIRKKLPKQVMHQTLKVILSYLWQSKKIEYTPEGIRWIL